MNRNPTSIGALRAPQRLAAALAATTVTVGIGAAVLLSFDAASPDIWLAPTPEVMELAAGCDRLTERQARETCLQQLVAARLAAEPQALRLAQR